MKGISSQRVVAVASLCFVATILATVSGESKPNDPVIASEADPRLRGQARRVDASDRLAMTATNHNFSGWGGVLMDETDDAVRLYWKGSLPREMSDAIADLREDGYRIEVASAAFSLAELDAEARRIVSLSRRDTGVQVTVVAPVENYSGLSVWVSRADEVDRARVSVKSKYPLHFGVMPEPQPNFWRHDDTSPFYGGAAIESAGSCSTGFAVRNQSGAQRMLTARHCGTNVNWYTPTARYVGTSASGNASRDANVLSGSFYSPTIYMGPWDSSTSRAVRGSGDPADESYIFISGAFSGLHVLRVKVINTHINMNGVTVGPGFITEDEQFDGSAGQGDSGGPLGNNNLDYTRVIARGINSARFNDTLVPCEGITTGGRICAWRNFNVNISAVLSSLSMQLLEQ